MSDYVQESEAAYRQVPTQSDELARHASELFGGPEGRHAIGGWLTPLRAVILIAVIAYFVGFMLDVPCIGNGWQSPDRYEHLCYSDIPPLYNGRGFAEGSFPYLQVPSSGLILEYPVLTGMFMQIAAWITLLIATIVPAVNTSVVFFLVNVVLLGVCLIITVAATALTYRRGPDGTRILRPWDAAMVGLAPGMILAATINWDLLPLAFVGVSLALWSRRDIAPKYATWAGVFLGLAIAAKFYPIFMLGPWFFIALRDKRLREFGRFAAGTAVAWFVVNIPFIIGNFDGWAHFYTFSSTRGEDFGSFWYAMDLLDVFRIPAKQLNFFATGTFLLMCAGIAVLILKAPRTPRLTPMLFLVVAAFTVTNKVYSPQYVLWLIPLAVLARPKWREFLIWQFFEVLYFVAIWWYLAGYGIDNTKGMTAQWYAVFTLLHIMATLWFCALLIWDELKPDPIDGEFEDDDVDLDDDPNYALLPAGSDGETARDEDKADNHVPQS